MVKCKSIFKYLDLIFPLLCFFNCYILLRLKRKQLLWESIFLCIFNQIMVYFNYAILFFFTNFTYKRSLFFCYWIICLFIIWVTIKVLLTEMKRESSCSDMEKNDINPEINSSEFVFQNWCNISNSSNNQRHSSESKKLNSSDCRICMNILKRPILIIPCGHSFCESVLIY